MKEKVIICPDRYENLVEKACQHDTLTKIIRKLEIRCEVLDELIELIDESEKIANGDMVCIKTEELIRILEEEADNR